MFRVRRLAVLICVAVAFEGPWCPATTNEDPVDCPALLDEPLADLPGWGFRPGELAEIGRMFPGSRALLSSDLRLARFVDDESNAELFHALATSANLGLANDFLPLTQILVDLPDRARGLVHRRILVRDIIEDTADQGLAPVNMDLRHLDLIASIMGPIPMAEPIPTADLLSSRFGPTKSYETVLRGSNPSLRQMVLHSKRAQMSLLSLAPNHHLLNFASGLRALQRRLTGDLGPETVEESRALDYVAAILDGNFPELKEQGLAGLRGARRREVSTSIERHHAANMLKALMTHVHDVFSRTHDVHGDLASPHVQMSSFKRLARTDVFIDQGLTTFFDRAYVEVILKEQSSSGPKLIEDLKSLLKNRFKAVRTEYRSILKFDHHTEKLLVHRRKLSEAAPLAGQSNASLGRAERIKLYEATTRATDDATNHPNVPLELLDVLARAPRPDSAAADEFWLGLVDPAQSLPEARARFEAQVRPETTYVLPLIRTGFQYRVQFSRDLIEQMLGPRAGEPADLRDWLEAFRQGPARAQNQRGWRKLNSLVLGKYLWEIKLRTSPYRILGVQSPEGIWHFDLVQLMH